MREAQRTVLKIDHRRCRRRDCRSASRLPQTADLDLSGLPYYGPDEFKILITKGRAQVTRCTGVS